MRLGGLRTAAAAVAMAAALVAGELAGPPAGAHTPHDDIHDIALSPTGEVALSVSRDMPLRSTDGGLTWSRVATGLVGTPPVTSFAFAPSQPEVAYGASRGGIYRSDDAGATWRPSADDGPAAVSLAVSPTDADLLVVALDGGGLARSDDGGATWNPVDGPTAVVRALAWSDATLVAGDVDGQLHLSDDDGRTWATRDAGEGHAVTAVGLAPDGGALLVATEGGGLLLADEPGAALAPVTVPPREEVVAIAVSPSFATDDTAWLTVRDSGVMTSTDGGERWVDSSDGLTTSDQRERGDDYAERPAFGPLQVAAPADDDPILLVGGFDGMFRSTDEAGTWTEVETLAASVVVGLAVSPEHATDQRVVASAYINGIHLSDDRGATWVAANDGLEEEVPYRSGPDRVARLFSVAIVPSDPSVMVVGRNLDVVRTDDGGATWEPVALPGLEEPERPHQPIVVAPPSGDEPVVYVADASTAQIFRSTDGGATFAEVGRTPVLPTTFAASPAHATDATLYAGATDQVYVSRDAGATWQPTGPAGEVRGVVGTIAPADGLLMARSGQGLWRSEDDGTTWERVPVLPDVPGAPVDALAVSPDVARDGIVVVALHGRGIFRSTDRGQTFAFVGENLLEGSHLPWAFSKPTSSALVFSPTFATDGTLYGFGGTDVLRSDDRGETWTVLEVPVARHEVPAATAAAPADGGSGSGGRRLAVAVAATVAAGAAVALGVRRRRGRRTAA